MNSRNEYLGAEGIDEYDHNEKSNDTEIRLTRFNTRQVFNIFYRHQWVQARHV